MAHARFVFPDHFASERVLASRLLEAVSGHAETRNKHASESVHPSTFLGFGIQAKHERAKPVGNLDA